MIIDKVNMNKKEMKEQHHQTRNIKRKEIMENEKSLGKRFCVCSPSSINRTVTEQESQTDEKQRMEEKEIDAFRNFWSGRNDKYT